MKSNVLACKAEESAFRLAWRRRCIERPIFPLYDTDLPTLRRYSPAHAHT